MTDANVRAKAAALLTQYLSVLPSTPEEQILRLIIELGLQIMEADEGSLLVLDEDAEELAFAVTVGSADTEQDLVGQRIPLGKGLTGLAALTREVQVGAPTFQVVHEEDGTTERHDVAGGQAVIAAPMLVGDTTVGVITAVSFDKDKRFTSKDARLYASFAAVAGVIVEQRRRLAVLEQGQPAAPESSADAAAAEPSLEQRVVASLSRIAHERPDSLAQVVQLVETVERLVIPERMG